MATMAQPIVLVVEDAGFDAMEAANTDEAVIILETRPDIRLAFTDIDMPGSMNGLRLAACIRDRWPPIALIVTSGKVLPIGHSLPDNVIFIAKPIEVGFLTLALQRMAV